MKTRWKILIVFGIFMAVSCVVSFVTVRVQPENAVEAYKKILRAQGEKLDFADIVPPPVPAESNSVDAVQDAFRMFGSATEKLPDAMKMVAPGKAMVGWMQPQAHGYDFTNSWDDFSAEVAADHPAIELLQQVLERPVLDFQLDYSKGAWLPLPHLAAMKRTAQKLEAAAVCDLHFGDTGAATTNILTLLGLVQKNAGEGLLISHLVRIAITAIGVVPTWELLQATNTTDAQLAALQKSWAQLDILSDTENSFVFERAWTTDEIKKSRASHEGFQKYFGSVLVSGGTSGLASGSAWPFDWETATERPRYAVAEVMWRSSWSYSAELHVLQTDQIVLDTLRAMRTNQSQFYKADYDAMAARTSALGITNSGAAIFRALKIPDFSEEFFDAGDPVVSKTLRIETARRIVVTAIALKRFQSQHGKFPETFDELTPKILPVVPIDPYDGKPLRYHPNSDGTFLLYSIGEDGVDDGGDASVLAGVTGSSFSWQGNHVRDWVWPQPATGAEIKYFYEHPPK